MTRIPPMTKEERAAVKTVVKYFERNGRNLDGIYVPGIDSHPISWGQVKAIAKARKSRELAGTQRERFEAFISSGPWGYVVCRLGDGYATYAQSLAWDAFQAGAAP